MLSPDRTRPTAALLAAALCLTSGAALAAAAARPAAKAQPAPRPAPANAQPAQDEDTPTTISFSCFTSACANPATTAVIPRNQVRVDAAIKAGDGRAALAAGGDGNDVLSAWAAADAAGGVRSRGPSLIDQMQTGQVVVENANDGGEILIRSTLPDGTDRILRRAASGVDRGRGPGG